MTMRRAVSASILLWIAVWSSWSGLALAQVRGGPAPAEPDPKSSKERERQAFCKQVEGLATYTSQSSLSHIFDILNDDRVGHEIKLTKDQRQAVDRVVQLTRETLQQLILRDLEFADQPKGARERRVQQTLSRVKEVISHAERLAVVGILDDDQAARAKRLYWRSLGAAALLETEVADRVKLSREQRKQVAARYNDLTRYTQEPPSGQLAVLTDQLRDSNPAVGVAAANAIQASHDDMEARVWDVLTPDQLIQFDAVLEAKIRRTRKAK